jgi:hypothetical protein
MWLPKGVRGPSSRIPVSHLSHLKHFWLTSSVPGSNDLTSSTRLRRSRTTYQRGLWGWLERIEDVEASHLLDSCFIISDLKLL